MKLSQVPQGTVVYINGLCGSGADGPLLVLNRLSENPDVSYIASLAYGTTWSGAYDDVTFRIVPINIGNVLHTAWKNSCP